MCRAVRCRSCGKTTWSGCGQHVDQVMRAVPKDDRCTCDRTAPSASGTRGNGWLSGLFRR